MLLHQPPKRLETEKDVYLFTYKSLIGLSPPTITSMLDWTTGPYQARSTNCLMLQVPQVYSEPNTWIYCQHVPKIDILTNPGQFKTMSIFILKNFYFACSLAWIFFNLEYIFINWSCGIIGVSCCLRSTYTDETRQQSFISLTKAMWLLDVDLSVTEATTLPCSMAVDSCSCFSFFFC